MSTLRVAISMILGMALPYLVQRWDRGRLTPERRAAAWNAASWGAAIYAWGPISMIAWVWVTRQRFGAWRRERGPGLALVFSVLLLVAGLFAALAVGAVVVGVDELLRRIAGQRE